MRPQEMQARLDAYARRAEGLAPGPARAVCLLGIMCVLAAAAGALVAMPEGWGWPNAGGVGFDG